MNKKGTGSKKCIRLEIYQSDAKRLFAGEAVAITCKGRQYVLIPPVKGVKK